MQDLHLASITPKQLDFSAPFTLTSTTLQRTKAHALALYFDTFFTLSGKPVPEGTEAKVVGSDDMQLAEIWSPGGRTALQRRRSRSVSVGKMKSAMHDASEKEREQRDLTNSPDTYHREGRPKEADVAASFSTGPRSMATHWKQTVFLLKEPVHIVEGGIVLLPLIERVF